MQSPANSEAGQEGALDGEVAPFLACHWLPGLGLAAQPLVLEVVEDVVGLVRNCLELFHPGADRKSARGAKYQKKALSWAFIGLLG